RFRSSNVTAQRQEGFSAVQVHVPRGDLSPEQLRSLADIARRYSGGWVRTTVHQNLLLRWVRDETVYEVWQELGELGLGDAGADQVGDVVSCPGTDSCKLGITSSMGLNAAVRERLKVRLPAKRVPEAVERWIRFYERDRSEGEEFNAFAGRVGTKAFEDEVRELALPVEFGLGTMEHFIDWERKVPFVVQRG